MMKILITGGAGYIGSVVTDLLLGQEHEVVILDKMIFGQDPEQRDGLTIYKGDICNIKHLSRAIRGCDAVIHLAGIVGDSACCVSHECALATNVLATRALMDLAGARRIVFASSCSVYGSGDNANENTIPNPMSFYAKTKLYNEADLQLYRHYRDAQREFTILRLGTVHGISQRMRFDLVVNKMAVEAATNGAITVYGGDQKRAFVHVEDVATSLVSAVTNAKPEFGPINICNENLTINEVAEKVREICYGTDIIRHPQDGDMRDYSVDNSFALKSDYYFYSTVEDTIRDIKDAVDWGQYQHYQWDKHHNNRYSYRI